LALSESPWLSQYCDVFFGALSCLLNTILNNSTVNSAEDAAVSTPVPDRVFAVDSLTVQIYRSPDEVARAASGLAKDSLQKALATDQRAAAIFATGRSQLQFLDYLTQSPDKTESQALDWSRVTGFHLDEYLGLSETHPASFRAYLRQHLTARVPLARFYAIKGDGLLPLDICGAYEAQLRAQPLTLCCLGVGNNGHLAFNDPAVANFEDPRWVNIVRLDEQNRRQQADSTDFADLQSVPHYAFTLTLSAIAAAQHSLCLAFGNNKAAIVKQLLTGPIAPSCPASFLRTLPQAHLLIDQAAASLLTD
jgi:glucosamine-6-phosphate deaminase